MTAKTLIIESGVAQTRATLIRDGEPARFWFGPAEGDEQNDHWPRAGRRFIGRIATADASLGGVFIEAGAGGQLFAPVKKAVGEGFSEGSFVETQIVSPPRQSKLATARVLGPAAGGPVGRMDIVSPACEAADVLSEGARLLVDRPEAAASLRGAGLEAEIAKGKEADSLFAACGADVALAGALARSMALPGGGSVHFDETEALIAIDIDAGNIQAASDDRLRQKLIRNAAACIVRQIELRNLGGRIVIDFPSARDKAVRGRIQETIEQQFRSLPGVSSLNISRGNFTALTLERRGASLWEEATEAAPSEPVPGRRFTIDWQIASALQQAEAMRRRRPQARLVLVAGARLHSALDSDRIVFDRFVDRYGASLAFERNDSLEERSFALVEQ